MSNVLQLVRSLEVRPSAAARSDVTVRNFAGSADIRPWLELRSKAFARQPVGVRAWDMADFAAEFMQKAWWNPDRMWIAEAAQPGTLLGLEFVGTVTCAMRGTGATARPAVHWLAVHPRWRKQGIGRMLLATLETACWDAGHRTICLETHADWAAAGRLYKTAGYVPA
ncbi:MAG: GNAT family N-acetyltransferase [Pirellulales bacterium]